MCGNCELEVANRFCTERYTVGRAELSDYEAIVLHAVRRNYEEYVAWLESSIQLWQPTDDPKSVHFFIRRNGAIVRFVAEQNTAWGVDNWNGATWPLLTTNPDPNAPFLHIGFEGVTDTAPPTPAQVEAASNLVCCLALDNADVIDREHVIVARDIQASRDQLWDVPAGLIEAAQACAEAGGINPLTSLASLEERVEILEAWAAGAEMRITALEASQAAQDAILADHEARITELEDWRAIAEPQITLNAANIAALQGQMLALLALFGNIQNCLDELCPPSNSAEEIHYQLSPSDAMVIVPNAPTWINLPVQISDTTPPSVTTGPMWTARLTEGGTYTIAAVAHLQGEWCVGKTATLTLVACGVSYPLSTITAPSNGYQTLTLTGTTAIVVPPACNDVHLMISHNDDQTPSKTLTFADIQITH